MLRSHSFRRFLATTEWFGLPPSHVDERTLGEPEGIVAVALGQSFVEEIEKLLQFPN